MDNSSDDEGFGINEPLVMGLDDVYECAIEENEINANEEESIIDAGHMMSEIDAIEDVAQYIEQGGTGGDDWATEVSKLRQRWNHDLMTLA